MKKNLFLIVLLSSILIYSGCKPQSKTFSMDVILSVQSVPDVSAVRSVAEILRSRLLTFGLKEESISSEINGNIIRLKLSGVSDTARVKKLLTVPGHLEFRETFENKEIATRLAEADKFIIAHPEVAIHDKSVKDVPDGSGLADKAESGSLKPDSLLTAEEWALRHPLLGRLRPNIGYDGVPAGGSVVGFAPIKDTSVVNTYLKMHEIRALMPADIRFVWSKNHVMYATSDSLFELHAIKLSTADGRPVLDGSAVVSAFSLYGKKNPVPVIRITMNNEGAAIWGRLTRDNINRCIAIIIDDQVVSSPRVISEITGGRSEISAGFSPDEASDLAIIINSGCLPAKVIIENL